MDDREGCEHGAVESTRKDMSPQRLRPWRVCVTMLVVLLELAHLCWEHFHGGVRIHHFLARSDMPAMSNWWGLLVLPVLAWFATGRLQKRIARNSDGHDAASTFSVNVVAGFAGTMLFGILLSVSFTRGDETITAYLFEGILLLALLLPAYRAECVLGFVLGMTFTFGVVLPAIVGSIIATLSAVVHLYVYPFFVSLWTWLKRR